MNEIDHVTNNYVAKENEWQRMNNIRHFALSLNDNENRSARNYDFRLILFIRMRKLDWTNRMKCLSIGDVEMPMSTDKCQWLIIYCTGNECIKLTSMYTLHTCLSNWPMVHVQPDEMVQRQVAFSVVTSPAVFSCHYCVDKRKPWKLTALACAYCVPCIQCSRIWMGWWNSREVLVEKQQNLARCVSLQHQFVNREKCMKQPICCISKLLYGQVNR